MNTIDMEGPNDAAEVELDEWLVRHADDILADDLPRDPVQLTKLLRKRYSVEQVTRVLELRDLRRRAGAKFSNGDRMFFTRLGLEQSTDNVIARYKAARFAAGCHVVDLCCGIGGDAIALARRGQVTAVDLDATTARFAQANLNACGFEQNSRVVCDDIRDVRLADYAAWHLDPDRRVGGGRRSAPEWCEPPLNEFLQWPGRPTDGAIKLAPAASVDTLLQRGVQLEWIGHQRQCQQLVAWFGALAKHPGRRTATWLWRDGETTKQASLAEEPHAEVGVWDLEERPHFLYEPQPPVLAAGLQDGLAARHNLDRISPQVSYFVGMRPLIDDPLLNTFEILEVMPLRVKQVRKRLQALDARVDEVKKRGVDNDPHDLQKQLASKGSRPVAVLLFPRGKSVQVVIGKRIVTA